MQAVDWHCNLYMGAVEAAVAAAEEDELAVVALERVQKAVVAKSVVSLTD